MKLGIIRGYSEEMFRYTKEHGLDFIEVCTNFDNESQAFIDAKDSIKALIAKYELPILSVGRWNSEPVKDGKINPDCVALLKEEIAVAAEIGSPVFNLGVNRDESITLYQNYVLAVEYLRDMLDFAAEKGITLALYNCAWGNFLCCDKAWDVVLPELPGLMIKYDCSHTYGRGDDYLAELLKWGNRIAHMHVKGSVIQQNTAPFDKSIYVDDPPAGMDALQWTKIFAVLYKVGYNGTMSIEPHSATWQGDLGEAGINFTIDFARKFMLR